jgi:Putative restriction endonuclease
MSIAETLKPAPANRPSSSIPKLRQGERLSRDEFERRYANMPDVKAELLDGVVYMSSPVSVDHGSPHGDLVGWLVYYKARTPGTDTGDNVTHRLSDETEPQPDAYLRILESHCGNSHVDKDRYVTGAPELLGETARSSKSYDLNVKKPIYKRDGVREFMLWRVDDNAIDWFVLRNNNYELLVTEANGIIRSETFPGL